MQPSSGSHRRGTLEGRNPGSTVPIEQTTRLVPPQERHMTKDDIVQTTESAAPLGQDESGDTRGISLRQESVASCRVPRVTS